MVGTVGEAQVEKVEHAEEGVLTVAEDEAAPMVVEDTMPMVNQMLPKPKVVGVAVRGEGLAVAVMDAVVIHGWIRGRTKQKPRDTCSW
ncbi:hypothetical protein V6N13_086636 [Hibiscus sabdariffa]|uniref:Uncharacterized protein n=1 Tax=Hibiscus sabdariffa TaxID=183260 RepID=A0ABR2FUJ4_9ROSI